MENEKMENEKLEEAKKLVGELAFIYMFEDKTQKQERITQIEDKLIELGIFNEKRQFGNSDEATFIYYWFIENTV